MREDSVALGSWILGEISFVAGARMQAFRVEDSPHATVLDGRN